MSLLARHQIKRAIINWTSLGFLFLPLPSYNSNPTWRPSISFSLQRFSPALCYALQSLILNYFCPCECILFFESQKEMTHYKLITSLYLLKMEIKPKSPQGLSEK